MFQKTTVENHPNPVVTVAPFALVLASSYIGVQMLSDVASLKIGVVGSLSVDMGTFIYPITFTLRDLIHKSMGKRAAQTLILSAGVINLFMALYLVFCALMPGDPDWGLNHEFAQILTPVWRIVLASIAAEVVSELLDTEVYQWFVQRTQRYQWMRVLLSNSVSVPVDNLIFSVGAFGWVLPWSTVADIFIINLAVKFGITIVSIPLIYICPQRSWRKNEAAD